MDMRVNGIGKAADIDNHQHAPISGDDDTPGLFDCNPLRIDEGEILMKLNGVNMYDDVDDQRYGNEYNSSIDDYEDDTELKGMMNSNIHDGSSIASSVSSSRYGNNNFISSSPSTRSSISVYSRKPRSSSTGMVNSSTTITNTTNINTGSRSRSRLFTDIHRRPVNPVALALEKSSGGDVFHMDVADLGILEEQHLDANDNNDNGDDDDVFAHGSYTSHSIMSSGRRDSNNNKLSQYATKDDDEKFAPIPPPRMNQMNSFITIRNGALDRLMSQMGYPSSSYSLLNHNKKNEEGNENGKLKMSAEEAKRRKVIQVSSSLHASDMSNSNTGDEENQSPFVKHLGSLSSESVTIPTICSQNNIFPSGKYGASPLSSSSSSNGQRNRSMASPQTYFQYHQQRLFSNHQNCNTINQPGPSPRHPAHKRRISNDVYSCAGSVSSSGYVSLSSHSPQTFAPHSIKGGSAQSGDKGNCISSYNDFVADTPPVAMYAKRPLRSPGESSSISSTTATTATVNVAPSNLTASAKSTFSNQFTPPTTSYARTQPPSPLTPPMARLQLHSDSYSSIEENRPQPM